MTKIALKIHDFMQSRRRFCLLSFIIVTSVLSCLLLRLDFKEDISDFLPLEGNHQEAMQVYQDVSGASKIIAIFQASDSLNANPDDMVEAIDYFENIVSEKDSAGYVRELTTQINLEKISEYTDFVYSNIPYFLSEEDYTRMDSLLNTPGYILSRLEEDKELLMFPTSGLLSENLQRDPLNLFSPCVGRLQSGQSADNIEMYDGYIFTPDMRRALVLMESPFGNSETHNNAVLMDFLAERANEVENEFSGVTVHYIGGPAIAVANATQIKEDSLLSIAIAAVLIVALLIIVFRKAWNIILIVISVGWGWLFAMAMVSVIHSSVSLIVVGISSIILGIAVNYPLHLIAHTAHTGSMKQVLREIIAPLIIGNITTVGAFVALVPLKAAALRDLGIFSALILIGTILFTVVFLPHAVRKKGNCQHEISVKWLDWLSNIRPEKNPWVVLGVVLLTVIFGYFSLKTDFDSNMSHINFMTDRQKADMVYFKELTSNNSDNTETLYVVSSGNTLDEAIDNNAALRPKLKQELASIDSIYQSDMQFLPSSKQQAERLERWTNFIATHKTLLTDSLTQGALTKGFQKEAFSPFEDILSGEYTLQDKDFFNPLNSINSQHLSIDSINGKYRVVNLISVQKDKMEVLRQKIDSLEGSHFCFDVQSMNSAIANGLSDNFSYIGWACGLIVFFFLWASFASIELALLSFLPMAVSWIWILGIMGMTGIQFNIVNIILATFIFGQGDDYTIFMTEGCCYEYAFRKKMLASYKSSILVSALIMFIGIGTLIFAKHPALHSLAEVTIVGMLSVVLMAYLLPPLVFNWITKSHGKYRKRPLTLGPLLRTWFCGAWWLSQLLIGYILGFFLFIIGPRTPKTLALFHRFVTWSHRIDLKLMPGVKFRMHNPYNETLNKPCVIVCNHQSLLDPMYFMAWSHKILIVANERSSMNPVVRIMFKWLGFYTIRQSNFTAWKDSSLERDLEIFKKYVEEGYSIAFFPEGMRNPDSSILRCHKGPFYLAKQLNIDVLPVLLHGVNYLMPIQSFACYKGEINMRIGKRITSSSPIWNESYSAFAQNVHRHMKVEYKAMCCKYETATYFASLVKDRYRYKGTELLQEVTRNLKKHNNYSDLVDHTQPECVVIKNCGYGEMALLMGLVHPDTKVFAIDPDEEKIIVAKYAAEGIITNVEFHTSMDLSTIENLKLYELSV